MNAQALHKHLEARHLKYKQALIKWRWALAGLIVFFAALCFVNSQTTHHGPWIIVLLILSVLIACALGMMLQNKQRLESIAHLSSIAQCHDNVKEMSLVKVDTFLVDNRIATCWFAVQSPSKEVTIQFEIEFGWDRKTAEEARKKCTELAIPGACPTQCVLLNDPISETPLLVFIRDSLLHVERRKGTENFASQGRTNARAKLDELMVAFENYRQRELQIANQSFGGTGNPLNRGPHQEVMVNQLLIEERNSLRFGELGCLVLLLPAIGVLIACNAFRMVLEEFVGWLLFPVGIYCAFWLGLIIYYHWRILDIGKIAAALKNSNPMRMLVTRVVVDLVWPDSKEVWLEVAQPRMPELAPRRMKVDVTSLSNLEFGEELYRTYKQHRESSTDSFILPCALYPDPATQEPLAISIDDVMLLIVDGTYSV